MKRVVVGTLNPAKLRPAEQVFAALYPSALVEGLSVPSGVPEQPIGAEETARGALNRARAALDLSLDRERGRADLGVGLEGGVRFDGDAPGATGAAGACWLFGVVAVVRPTERGYAAELGHTAQLRLPPLVAARLRAGEELGPVMDRLFRTVNIKQGVGTVGVLTRGQLSRSDIWQQALTLALAPLLNAELYQDGP